MDSLTSTPTPHNFPHPPPHSCFYMYTLQSISFERNVVVILICQWAKLDKSIFCTRCVNLLKLLCAYVVGEHVIVYCNAPPNPLFFFLPFQDLRKRVRNWILFKFNFESKHSVIHQWLPCTLYDMGETFQTTARFKDSDIFQKAMKWLWDAFWV